MLLARAGVKYHDLAPHRTNYISISYVLSSPGFSFGGLSDGRADLRLMAIEAARCHGVPGHSYKQPDLRGSYREQPAHRELAARSSLVRPGAGLVRAQVERDGRVSEAQDRD